MGKSRRGPVAPNREPPQPKLTRPGQTVSCTPGLFDAGASAAGEAAQVCSAEVGDER